MGEDGVCPLPGDPGFSPGLTQSHHCVLMLIEDGGVNDGDGLRNSVVADPGGVATLDVISPNDTASRSGCGSIGLIFLLLMPGLYRLNGLLRRNYRLPIYKDFYSSFAITVK